MPSAPATRVAANSSRPTTTTTTTGESCLCSSNRCLRVLGLPERHGRDGKTPIQPAVTTGSALSQIYRATFAPESSVYCLLGQLVLSSALGDSTSYRPPGWRHPFRRSISCFSILPIYPLPFVGIWIGASPGEGICHFFFSLPAWRRGGFWFRLDDSGEPRGSAALGRVFVLSSFLARRGAVVLHDIADARDELDMELLGRRGTENEDARVDTGFWVEIGYLYLFLLTLRVPGEGVVNATSCYTWGMCPMSLDICVRSSNEHRESWFPLLAVGAQSIVRHPMIHYSIQTLS